MLQSKKKRWFRGCALGVAGLTLWFALGIPTVAYAAGRERRAQGDLAEVTRRLGLEAGTDAGPRVAERRARSLARLRALGAPQAEALQRARKAAGCVPS